jgi:hypothetical protein
VGVRTGGIACRPLSKCGKSNRVGYGGRNTG